MGQLQYQVLNMAGEEVGAMELDPRVFGAELKESLVHATVRWQRASRRAGNHSALNRANMKGGGSKPWRQKGTGRARAGSRNSPVWVGGAVAHGPQPRSYSFRLSKRARRQALTSVLTDKVLKQRLRILDKIEIGDGKTKSAAGVLGRIGIGASKAVIVNEDGSVSLARATRNIPGVQAVPVEGVNVFDLMRHEYLVCTEKGVKALQDRLIGVSAEGDNAVVEALGDSKE